MEKPKFQEKNAEEGVGKFIKGSQKQEKEKAGERKALAEVLGAEKATKEQIRELRTELGEEGGEEKKAERKAQLEVVGPQRATKEQEETFKPIEDEEEFKKAA
ncbi:hypothetical protein KJ885_05680 [Patescibacteria group bacterium]|nr:hypothetical protein [Patescibacteria group bacterium]